MIITNEYTEEGKLFLKRIRKCKCLKKAGGEYFIQCKITQRGEHDYCCDEDAKYIRRIPGEKIFWLDREARAVVLDAIREFDDLCRFAKDNYIRIYADDPQKVLYFARLSNRTFECVFKYINESNETVLEHLHSAPLEELMHIASDRLPSCPRSMRLTAESIESDPLYVAAKNSDDEMLASQIRTYYNIDSDRDRTLLERILGIRVLPVLPEEYNKNYVIYSDTIDTRVLDHSGYRILHRPYFGMMNSTHSKWQLNPHTKTGVDAAEEDAEAMDFKDFLTLFDS